MQRAEQLYEVTWLQQQAFINVSPLGFAVCYVENIGNARPTVTNVRVYVNRDRLDVSVVFIALCARPANYSSTD